MKLEPLMESEQGYAMENIDEKKIYVYTYSMRDFDGIPDTHPIETVINYETGLFQQWAPTGYYAKYYDDYRGKDKAIDHVKRRLGL